LLRSGLPAFGTTTAVQTPSSLWLETDLPTLAVSSLRVLPASCLIAGRFDELRTGMARSYKWFI